MKENNQERYIVLSEIELRAIMKETVHNTLLTLGIQDCEPIEMQKDFQLLREWRKSTESVKRKGLMIVVTCICSGVLAAVWISFKELLKA